MIMRLPKILLCIMLIICLIGTNLINAYAGPFLGLAGSGLFALIAKGLIAAGLVFGVSYGVSNIDTIVNNYWNQQSETLKNEWLSMTLGAVMLTTNIWNSLRAFVNSYTTEDLIISRVIPENTEFRMLDANGIPFDLPPLPSNNAIYSPYADHVIVGYDTFDRKYYAIYTFMGYINGSYDSTKETIVVWPDATAGSTLYYLNESTNLWVKDITTYVGSGNKVYHLDNSRGNVFFIGLFGATKYGSLHGYEEQIDNNYIQVIYENYSNIYRNCDWFINASQMAVDVATGGLSTTFDYTHSQTGDKTIYVPTDISASNVNIYADGLLDKTFTDIASETIPATDLPIEDTGTLAGVIAAVNTMAVDIARFFDLTQPLNFEPLKIAGTMFSTRFPFSLPWDLYNSFASLSAPGVKPDFNIVVPDTKLLKGMSFNVDLSMFDDLIAFAKIMELLAFDIGLILITRKILGGDA